MIKAIVLTCDKYQEITYHMILTYETLWPSNSFEYLVPWNEVYPKKLMMDFGDKITLIKSPVKFKETIKSLLEGIDDNEWIYWATDDTYLMTADESIVNITDSFVKSIKNKAVFGVTFGFIKQVPEHINLCSTMHRSNICYVERTKVTNHWAPQYFRAKVLRYLFTCFDEPKKHRAKQMDNTFMTKKWYDYTKTGKFYTIDHQIATWGESTYRGMLTRNCSKSFDKYKLKKPDNFVISNRIKLFK